VWGVLFLRINYALCVGYFIEILRHFGSCHVVENEANLVLESSPPQLY
jgi:hypothetical protein